MGKIKSIGNAVKGILKRHRRIAIASGSVFLALVIAFSGVELYVLPKGAIVGQYDKVLTVGEKQVVLTIGTVEAATVTDYQTTGINDSAVFQIALNALPASGGKLEVLGGTYNFVATVSRAINNVTIEGVGTATYFNYDGVNPIFSAGVQSGWKFSNFSTDTGGLNIATATRWIQENITIGATYYAYRVADDITASSVGLPVGRTVTFVVASANATAGEIAQADYIADGTADDVQINAAIAALPADGGKVSLSGGTFYLSSEIAISNDNIILEGVGYSTILLAGAVMTYSVNVSSNYNHIRDLYIDGNGVAAQFRVDGSYVTIYNVFSTEHTTYNLYTRGNNNRVSNSWFYKRTVRVEGGAVEFYANNFNGDGAYVSLEWDASGSLYGNTFETYAGYAIRVGYNATPVRAAFIGNYFETASATTATIRLRGNPSIASMTFDNNYDAASGSVNASLLTDYGLVSLTYGAGNNMRNGLNIDGRLLDEASIQDVNNEITFRTLTGLSDIEVHSGNVTVWTNAAPTTGTWAVGDIVWNVEPAAFEPLGWRNITAGTPGTWEIIATDYPQKIQPSITRWVIPGWFVQNDGNQAITANRIYYIPIFVSETTTYTRIGIRVSVGAAGSADLRIFAWNSGVPGALILNAGTVDTTNVSTQEIVIAQTLTRGYYFLAIRADAAPSLRSPATNVPVGVPVSGVSTSGASFVFYPIMTVDAAYADPAPAPTAVAGVGFAFVSLREN